MLANNRFHLLFGNTLSSLLLTFLAASSSQSATIPVTTTADMGAGSLRQAILDSNTSVGVPDTIAFNIQPNDPGHVYYREDGQVGLPGGNNVTVTTEANDANLDNPDQLYPRSWYRIAPASQLPFVTDPVIIDGYTQPGSSPNTGTPDEGLNTILRIELYGDSAGFAVHGIFLDAGSGGSIIRGLAIRDFSGNDTQSGHGILIASNGNTIEGNFIGPGVDGLGRSNNTHGIQIFAGTNTIGGLTPAARNLISGNNRYGLILNFGGGGHRVEGNLIGPNRTGISGLGNFRDGVLVIDSPNNQIGGTSANARNVVSGNAFGGISILNAPSSGNVVQGNYVGTDMTGLVDMGNSFNGILTITASGNLIGGSAPGAGNLSSGNGHGGITLVTQSTNNLVQGNVVGTDLTGALAIPNDFGGVFAIDSSDNTIGGTEAEANTIAFNTQGVNISQLSLGNAVRRNSIYSNGALGIDLTTTLGPNSSGDGANENDAGDVDMGTNNLQNKPDLVSADVDQNLNVTYSVDTVAPNAAFPLTVDFYLADIAAQEGRTWVGEDTYNSGDGQQVAVLALKGGVSGGDNIVATATDAEGNSSEFSAPVVVGGGTSQRAFVVNSTGDSPDQNTLDGECNTGNLVNGEPECTLCAAIEQANTLANLGTPDRVEFQIPASDPGHVYYQNDGQIGSVSFTLVAVTAAASDGAIGNIDPDWPQSWWTIRPQSSLPTISDPIVIDGFTQTGASANSNAVGSGLNSVLRIEINGAEAEDVPDGMIRINSGGSQIIGLTLNRVDGPCVHLESVGENNITGNYLGPDVSGSVVFPRPGGPTTIFDRPGVLIVSSENQIGGASPEARNLISGNSRLGGDGIVVGSFFGGVSGNLIQGNLVGTDRSGNAALLNAGSGISLKESSNNQIGGLGAGEGNVLSGNRISGIQLVAIGAGSSDENDIVGNLIGANASGDAGVPNETAGVSILNGTGNRIEQNTIAFNLGQGIVVDDGSGNLLTQNSIYDNGMLGIDLSAPFMELEGINLPQDTGDADVGANQLQNFPSLTSITENGANLTVEGDLQSKANSSYRIEFFSNPARDILGFGEGEHYLGFTDVTTNGAGTASFSATVPNPPAGDAFISATATDITIRPPAVTSANDTSEFSGLLPIAACSLTVLNANDNGIGSLREAIYCANSLPGVDTVAFSIPGAGPHSIVLSSPLPSILDPVIVDGYTQGDSTAGDSGDDASANTNPIDQGVNAVIKVRIDGSSLDEFENGLRLLSGDNVIRGLSITGCPETAIQIQQLGGNVISGNFLGVNPQGEPFGNGYGVYIDASPDNRIGGPGPADRNIISGNDREGILVERFLESAGTVIEGNFIGIGPDRMTEVGNNYGIYLEAIFVRIEGNVIAFNEGTGVGVAPEGRAALLAVMSRFLGILYFQMNPLASTWTTMEFRPTISLRLLIRRTRTRGPTHCRISRR